MRINPDTCRDPVLLAAEVRRLRNVFAADGPWLTDAEREAVEWVIFQQATPQRIAVTLRGLLDQEAATVSDTNERAGASTGSVAGRITAYLASGGLFNPEQAIHDRVRNLLIDCRDEIERRRFTDAEREAVEWAESAARDCEHPADAPLRGLLERLGGDE